MAKPRILVFDIESAGVQALKSDLGFVICFGYRWVGEKKTHCIISRKKDLRTFSDRWLLKKASKIMTEADLLVGHFASVFDRRFIQGRLLINNLPPIPPTKMRDTCIMARSRANYSSNRLVHLAKILKLKHKKHDKDGDSAWPDAWFRVMQGDMVALRALAVYCKGDVEATEDLYLRLLPFDAAHTRVYDDRTKCGVCGGVVQFRGSLWASGRKYRRVQCTACGRWGQGGLA